MFQFVTVDSNDVLIRRPGRRPIENTTTGTCLTNIFIHDLTLNIMYRCYTWLLHKIIFSMYFVIFFVVDNNDIRIRHPGKQSTGKTSTIGISSKIPIEHSFTKSIYKET